VNVLFSGGAGVRRVTGKHKHGLPLCLQLDRLYLTAMPLPGTGIKVTSLDVLLVHYIFCFVLLYLHSFMINNFLI
jgi:hypothetical protein